MALATGGILLVDKPSGMTSHDVVSRVRRAAGTRKVGHAGTLDPMATGLLVLGIDNATRLLTYLVGLGKVYEATIRLGASTTTDDREGEVTERAAASAIGSLTADDIERGMAALRGEISQVPSSVSAIKVGGRRAHERMRAGESVELAARPVTVTEFVATSEPRFVEDDSVRGLEFDARVACSSGTYVRALARDLGSSLGVGGHLTALRRTAVGPFRVDAAVQLDSLVTGDVAVRDAILSHAAVATALFPAVRLDGQQSRDLRDGKRPTVDAADAEIAAMLDAGGALVGLASIHDGTARVVMNLPVPPGEETEGVSP